ncbi:unnamed protein product [Caenorhabditis brenneri]
MEADSYFLNGIIVFSTWVPKKSTTYQTTRLVTIMTSCLVITEGFTGLVGATFTLLADGSALIIISAGLNMFFHLLYSMNSMAHCFIAMLLSSQYKRCARDALPCMRVFGRKSKTATALMSIPSTNSRLDRERLS